MKEKTVDLLMILLALLAPILLIVLSKWQYSLNTWYIPLNEDSTVYFSPNLERDISNLPEVIKNKGATLFFITDSKCACTKATLNILQTTIQASKKVDMKLVVLDIHSPNAKSELWQRILKNIPATPTLLITDHNRLVYAGPATTGNMCTTSVLKILGISVLEAKPQAPVINWLEKGCYCPMKP